MEWHVSMLGSLDRLCETQDFSRFRTACTLFQGMWFLEMLFSCIRGTGWAPTRGSSRCRCLWQGTFPTGFSFFSCRCPETLRPPHSVERKYFASASWLPERLAAWWAHLASNRTVWGGIAVVACLATISALPPKWAHMARLFRCKKHKIQLNQDEAKERGRSVLVIIDSLLCIFGENLTFWINYGASSPSHSEAGGLGIFQQMSFMRHTESRKNAVKS